MKTDLLCSLALAVSLLASASPDATACSPPGRVLEVLTPEQVPAGAGVLVRVVEKGASEDESEPRQPSWVWTSDAGKAKPTITTLAPGLVLYKLPAGVTAAQLHDGTQARATVKIGDASETTLPAPAVAGIEHMVTKLPHGRGGMTTVMLTSAPPPEAVAMIIYDAKKRALSYGPVVAGETELVVYALGICSLQPKGTVAPKVNQKVTLRYVDRFGRLSPASTAKKIVAMKEVPDEG